MRFFILIFFCIACFGYAYAQTPATAPGYYVTMKDDTVTTQIKLPKSLFGSLDFSKLIFKVEVMDSINGAEKFKPDDIKCFGFVYKEENYRFFSKPAITLNNLRFIQPVILGPNTNLYQFQTVDQNGAPLGVFYTFEKLDGSYTFLSTGLINLNKVKETLKEFYKENVAIQAFIDTKFQAKTAFNRDVITVVQEVNKL
jgi:hypothetical protein